MDMTGEERISAPRDAVWRGLNDPEILKRCIPGCQSIEMKSPTELSAVVKIKIGPVSASFTGDVILSNLNPPESYTISGEGKGGIAGFAKGGADVTLVDDGAETRAALRRQGADRRQAGAARIAAGRFDRQASWRSNSSRISAPPSAARRKRPAEGHAPPSHDSVLRGGECRLGGQLLCLAAVLFGLAMPFQRLGRFVARTPTVLALAEPGRGGTRESTPTIDGKKQENEERRAHGQHAVFGPERVERQRDALAVGDAAARSE